MGELCVLDRHIAESCERGRRKIQHAPMTRLPLATDAIMQLGWIDGNRIACTRLNQASPAPTILTPRDDVAKAELIMRMAWKSPIRLD